MAIACTLLMASCDDTPSKTGESTEEHGYERDADGNHLDDEQVEQEEFMVGSTSTEMKEGLNTHRNNDDLEHHDH